MGVINFLSPVWGRVEVAEVGGGGSVMGGWVGVRCVCVCVWGGVINFLSPVWGEDGKTHMQRLGGHKNFGDSNENCT